MTRDDLWTQLEELEREFANIHQPAPDERKSGTLFIRALMELRQEIKAVRALARSR